MNTVFCLPPLLRHATITLSVITTRRVSRFSHRFSTSTRVLSSDRTYAEAIKLLDSLQSNRAVVSAISNSSRDLNEDAIPEMLEWTRKAGYDVSDFAKSGLKCVHVAGTKGKGSVCAMVENILMQYRGEDTRSVEGKREYIGKVGLYTSPHLVTVRERIRIDGCPISETKFTQYFFELWDRFSSAASPTPQSEAQASDGKPGYFRYLTLLAFHTFMKEGVETAILECGIGGEYDSTNILPPQTVTVSAITKLGIDHVPMLGNNIQDIAWHKSGIVKKGVPAFTVQQVPEAQKVLEDRASSRDVELKVVKRNPVLESGDVKLGIEGDVQLDNASLAVAIAEAHLNRLEISTETHREPPIPQKFILGLETVRLQGRCQVLDDGKIRWLIDGAHTEDSIVSTAHWYRSKLAEAEATPTPPTATMLIFNQQYRNVDRLILSLISTLSNQKSIDINDVPKRWRENAIHPGCRSEIVSRPHFRYAAFCQNTVFEDQVQEGVDLVWQEKTAQVYSRADTNTLYMCYGSVEEAVKLARKVSEDQDDRLLVLVTGSLHLVGGVLQVLERDQKIVKDLVG